MDTETQLNELADSVASILAAREGFSRNTKVLIGEVALVAGATYIVVKVVQTTRFRRWKRKNLGYK
jgi:hypothetical protein